MLPALLALALCAVPLAPQGALRELRAVAGESGDAVRATYVRLEGTQRDIGRALAELAATRHGTRPEVARDPLRTRAQRSYFERNDPLFVERMRGVAAHFGLDIESDAHELASLSFGFGRPGCSVVYHPPATTATGSGVVARNFDFTTGTMAGALPGPGEEAVCAAPYVLELHPDRGYATLSLCAYDLLGGVIDGVNSCGLSIALLADDEAVAAGKTYASSGPQAGFGVLEIGRHLLETCADVPEAKQALLEAKLYYGTIPCHYLIADAHGAAFVWENSPAMSVGFIHESPGEPLATTNFLRYLHPDLDALPEERAPLGNFNRYRALLDGCAARGPLTLDAIRALNGRASPTGPAPKPPLAPGRTLWCALYLPEQRRLEIDFYLGETRAKDGSALIRRSPVLSFALAEPKGTSSASAPR